MPNIKLAGPSLDKHFRTYNDKPLFVHTHHHYAGEAWFPREPHHDEDCEIMGHEVHRYCRLTSETVYEFARMVYAARTAKKTVFDPHTGDWRKEFWFD